MIISSLLDTDLYKLTMMQVVLHNFPAALVEYRFHCRQKFIDLASYIPEIQKEIDHLCTLSFTEDELCYLNNLSFLTQDFIDFLSLFRLNKKYIFLQPSLKVPGELDLSIKGPWLHTILFETALLAIINEIYFRHISQENIVSNNLMYKKKSIVTQLDTMPRFPGQALGLSRLHEKIAMLREEPGCAISDYGTRRRFSNSWHREIIQILSSNLAQQFCGTSNVLYAKEFNLLPLGTMAHEYLQACQVLGPCLRDSQVFAFETWSKEYRGNLGIALSDTYGIDAFCRDFDKYFCKLFDGVRHDSGDPFVWAETMISHYQNNSCDPKTKVLVFSDGLDIPTVLKLFHRFHKRCLLAFGIGTNLTNDLGYVPLPIVIKLVSCNGQPVAKLTDSLEKRMCVDLGYISYLKTVFGVVS